MSMEVSGIDFHSITVYPVSRHTSKSTHLEYIVNASSRLDHNLQTTTQLSIIPWNIHLSDIQALIVQAQVTVTDKEGHLLRILISTTHKTQDLKMSIAPSTKCIVKLPYQNQAPPLACKQTTTQVCQCLGTPSTMRMTAIKNLRGIAAVKYTRHRLNPKLQCLTTTNLSSLVLILNKPNNTHHNISTHQWTHIWSKLPI